MCLVAHLVRLNTYCQTSHGADPPDSARHGRDRRAETSTNLAHCRPPHVLRQVYVGNMQ
jgi:hypothetical protein